MDLYGKVFRDIKTNDIVLRPYNPDKEKYYELIKAAKNEGLKQVIINSEIMTSILYNTIEQDGIVLKVNMTENTDQDVKDNVQLIIKKLRYDKLVFSKLKDELEWAEDSNSIDITSIEIYLHNKKYQIFSNGIVAGSDINKLFVNNIKAVLEEYFNG